MSGFARNVVRLGVGYTAAQLINLATIPVITRLYSPSEFGYFSAYIGTVTILAPICSMRMSYFVGLPDNEQDAAILLLLSMLFAAAISLVAVPLLLCAVTSFDVGLRQSASFRYLWLLPVGMVCLSVTDSVSCWNLRHKQFSTISIARVIEVLADRIIGVTAGLTGGFGAVSLIVARLVGAMLSAQFSLRNGVLFRLAHELRGTRSNELLRVFNHYKRTAGYSALAVLTSSGSRELPAVVIAINYGAAAAGYYALCLRILNLPIMTIGDVVTRVHYQHIADLARAGNDLAAPTLRVLKYMFYLIFPCALLVFWFGVPLFSLVFGPQWIEAGHYAQVLVLGFVFTFLHRIPNVLFDVLPLNKARFGFEMAYLVLRLGALIGAALFTSDIFLALYALLAVSVIVILASTFYLLDVIEVGVGRWVKFFTELTLRFWPLLVGMPILREAIEISRPELMFGSLVSLMGLQIAILLIHDGELRKRTIRTIGAWRQ